jgi:small redox-active disulfide protein 2
MKKIQILGTGCSKCNLLVERTEKVAKDLQIEYELFKVNDLEKITDLGVMVTPALAIDGTVKIAGKVPSEEQIKIWLRE